MDAVEQSVNKLPAGAADAALKEVGMEKDIIPDDGKKAFPEAKFTLADQKAFIRQNHQGLGLHWTQYGIALNCALHMLGHLPTLLCFVGTILGGGWTWMVVFVGWVLVPILDIIIGADSYNLTDKEEKEWRESIWFRVVTWCHLPLQVSYLTFACWWITSRELTNLEWYGILFSCGSAQGFGIGCAHEMLHRPSLFDTMNSMISLSLSSYGHFWIEHLWGHHRNVATDLDCASSKVGDISWFFVPRCMITTAIEAWQIECKILRSKGINKFHPYYNRYIIAWIFTLSVAYFYSTVFGPECVSFFFLQGLIASYIVDNTNFIEHYGLRRRELKPGQFEPVGWLHSWDTGDFLTNYMLFKIQRHPDHHTNAARPYQILRTFKDAPTLPTGYAGMIVLSWFPPLFQYVMDWRVARVQEQAYELANYGTVNGEKYIFPDGARAVSSCFKDSDDIFLKDHKMYKEAGADSVIKKATSTRPKNDLGLKRVDAERENVSARWMLLAAVLLLTVTIGGSLLAKTWPGRYPELIAAFSEGAVEAVKTELR